ncbi:hypothetical protein ABW19_dt0208346 [Dactylella cylindrospora]|nr:hypothetical protein ABW19_dt0208346 [Dactylella cylindrospora]
MMETYHGQVRSPMDAIILFEACRLGLLPRVQRRLSDKERQSIKSGSIFVWDEREAGMRRWTDGKSWSASRVSGSFLCYREMEGKRGGGSSFPSAAPTSRNGKSPDNGSDSDSDNRIDPDDLVAEGYRYKPDGLMKQSFSITTSSNQKLHLISYYARSQSSPLMQPSADPQLKHILPLPGMYPEQTMQDQPPPQPPHQGQTQTTAQTVMSVPAQRAMLPSPFAPSQNPTQSPHHPEMQPPQLAPVPHLQGFSPMASQVPGPYGWPPSPISTPPTNFPPNNSYGAPPSLPAPLTSASSTVAAKGPYDPNLPAAPGGYTGVSSPLHYDQTTATLQPLQPHISHRPSIPSSIVHLHPPQSSPRLSHFHQNPLPLLPPENPRYSSPTSGTQYPSRTSPRPTDPWEPPSNFNPAESSTIPGTASLDVQDIPNEKLGFGEDVRALRQLDKASFANFTIR